MKKTLLYTSLLLITLFIGFAIGFLISGRLIKSKVTDMRSFYTPDGFHHQLIRVVHPTPEQTLEIKPILSKYAVENQELLWDFKADQQALFLELKEELTPFLSTEQMERLNNLPKKRFLKNKEEINNRRKHRNSNSRQNKHRPPSE